MSDQSAKSGDNWPTLIGKRFPRVDAVEKVNGEAKYSADFDLSGQLWMKVLRSPHPHANIISIDASKALALPGVKGVVTGKDFQGWSWGWGPTTRDETPLADEKVRYYAEGVAAVAAEDEETAEEACGLIEVVYEELPGVFDAEEAMQDGAPQVHDYVENNQSWDFHMDYGDVEKGFAEADLVREDRFETGRTLTGFLEPPAAVAKYDSTSGITIWAAKQSPYFIYRQLASCFKLPLSKVRVIQPYVGGGFGGTKNDSTAGDFCAVMLAKMTKRPVKFVYNMEEVLTTCRRRHNMIVDCKMGMKNDGTITAVQTKVIADGGAFTAIGPLTMYLTGIMTTLPYKLDNYKHDAYRIFTNHPVSAAMRGHGVTHTRFAAEIQMEKMADELGIDPYEVRMKNAIEAPHETVNGITVDTCGLKEGLEIVASSSAWKNKDKNKKDGPVVRGVGISGTSHLGGARQRGHQSCAAIVRLCEDGTVNYLTGASDAGQGSDTVLVQLVAEELGLPMEDVTIQRVDTAVTPVDNGSYGSRVTILAGQAAQQAAQDIKRQLAEAASKIWEVEADKILFSDRTVFVEGDPDKSMPFRKLTQIACYSEAGAVIIGKGYSQYKLEKMDFEKGYGNPGLNYSFTSQLSAVDVDLETGMVKAKDFLIAHDCGRPLHPVNVEAQTQGAASQGLGQALYENFRMSEGRTMNPTMVNYMMPLSTEHPDFELHDIITDDPHGPHGAKEASEGSIISTPPSIISAIHDATGIWFTKMPVTPEKIVMALKEKRDKEEGT